MKTGHDRYLEWFKEQTMQGIEPTPEAAFMFALRINDPNNISPEESLEETRGWLKVFKEAYKDIDISTDLFKDE